MCIYINTNLHTNLPVNTIVRLPHLRSGNNQGSGNDFSTFCALLTSKPAIMTQECSSHHPSLSTLKSKELSHSRMNW